jgi:predicted nicotinamide N-methyase
MKAAISDLDIFPHELEGLRLWDIDVIVARYVILESDRFKGRDVLVVKSGVGLAGVALGKWTEAKSITLCDVREEVVRNGVKNCVNNGVGNVISFRLTP